MAALVRCEETPPQQEAMDLRWSVAKKRDGPLQRNAMVRCKEEVRCKETAPRAKALIDEFPVALSAKSALPVARSGALPRWSTSTIAIGPAAGKSLPVHCMPGARGDGAGFDVFSRINRRTHPAQLRG